KALRMSPMISLRTLCLMPIRNLWVAVTLRIISRMLKTT
ncbi:flaG family protein, partial [Vibrio parahaemolyticus VPTS-2010_2]